MSCCSSSSITPCSISVNDALTLLDGVGNNCGSLCNYSVATEMPPSPVPQYSSVIQVEDYLVPEGSFSILNFEASGASFSTVTDNGNGRCTINVDTQLVERRLWGDALTEMLLDQLIPGKLYWIYDKGDASLDPTPLASKAYAGIILQALDVNKFSGNGIYIARVPNRLNTLYWYNGGSYGQNSFVENLNYVYTNANGFMPPSAVPPSADIVNWTLVPKSDITYYDTDIFTCIYDIESDQILSITDNSNNTVSITLDKGAIGISTNEIFLHCFRWGFKKSDPLDTLPNIYGNKITINNIPVSAQGYVNNGGVTTYPNIARSLSSGNCINFNFWNFDFYGNEIVMDIGKGNTFFNSVQYQAPDVYASFYNFPFPGDKPVIANNKFFNTDVFFNEYINIQNNLFNECLLGNYTSTTNIIEPGPIFTFGQILSSTFYTCRIRNNAGSITSSHLRNSNIYQNNPIDAVELVGTLEIGDNENITILKVNGLNRGVDTSSYSGENKINTNLNIYIRDLVGDRFVINQNENIGIYDNIRLYNGNIARNTAPLAPELLDQDAVTPIPIPTDYPMQVCCIIRTELVNFSRIADCEWETAGAISSTRLSRGEIRWLRIDFRDPAWAAGGSMTFPPALAKDMTVDGVDIYLFQNRAKLDNYQAPAIINGLTGTHSSNLDGINGPLTTSTFPALNPYYYDALATLKWKQLNYVSSSTEYALGGEMKAGESNLYVFLKVNDNTSIYDPAAKRLKLPSWSLHASIIYLYHSTNVPFTCDIEEILDQVDIDRPIYNFRIIALSDLLTVNVITESITTATADEIVSSNAAPYTATLTSKYDILELEKRNNIYYMSEYQKMS